MSGRAEAVRSFVLAAMPFIMRMTPQEFALLLFSIGRIAGEVAALLRNSRGHRAAC